METKVSVLRDSFLSGVVNVDALVLPADNMLNLKISKAGKEVSDMDGGNLPAKLFDIRRNFTSRTGSIRYPEATSLGLATTKFPVQSFIVSVLPMLPRTASRDVKVKAYYATYMSALTLAVESGFRTVAMPFLGQSRRGVHDNILVMALFTAVSDFIKSTSFLDEICIVPKSKEEELKLFELFNNVSRVFGIEFWYSRVSPDLSTRKYEF